MVPPLSAARTWTSGVSTPSHSQLGAFVPSLAKLGDEPGTVLLEGHVGLRPAEIRNTLFSPIGEIFFGRVGEAHEDRVEVPDLKPLHRALKRFGNAGNGPVNLASQD